MQRILPPSMVAAGIAGAGIGVAAGFMTKGETLENQGASPMQQLGGGIAGGIGGGVAGAGIGIGVSGTAVALKHILKK
jgi:hypothetical protein